MALKINFKTLDGIDIVDGCVEISGGDINQANMNVYLTYWSCVEAKLLGHKPCQMQNTVLNISYNPNTSQISQAYDYLKTLYPDAVEVNMPLKVIPIAIPTEESEDGWFDYPPIS